MKGRQLHKHFRERLETIVQTLRDEILDGRYAVGSFLPSELALAQRFRISNKSLRSGLAALVKEGLIEKVPSVGNRVVTRRTRVTLTLLSPPTMLRDINLMKLLEDFGTIHPWIRIETIFGFANEQYVPADLCILNRLQFREMVEADDYAKLEPLQPSGDAYPFLTDAFAHKEHVYAQPFIFSPIVLCYNKEHFRERNVPEPDGSWTWEHLIRAAAELSVEGERFGICFHLPSEHRWPLFLVQSGETFQWEAGGSKSIEGTRLLDSMRLCKSIIRNRTIFPFFLSENNDDTQNLFAEGKVSMILNNYMSMNDLANTRLPYDISPVPFESEPRTLLVTCGIGIYRHSAKKEAAALLVDYFVSERGQDFIRRTTTSIPACKQVAERDFEKSGMNRPSRYGLFREILFSMRNHSELNIPAACFKPLLQPLKAYWSDLIDERQLCARIQKTLSSRSSKAGELEQHVL
ncbi:extracellular solute-binding protein [Paenibacillus ginsengarvi]|uniref:Extracellular solute-binding protein n=1 Tax=Paenibacillus ginsengarvi TaxID=400777 RepID=A0A3B0C773_9BACL|nr:extracellular solute-binding protein [Paenibacillus ginsengarvi]RKN80434.1 extracellular solute-binding protein [Paenibacillus ginsengarvi]